MLKKIQSVGVVAQGVGADRLAFTKQGEVLLAASLNAEPSVEYQSPKSAIAGFSASAPIDALFPVA